MDIVSLTSSRVLELQNEEVTQSGPLWTITCSAFKLASSAIINF